jgi:predicted alpha/beta-fold hydrolase
MNPPVSGRDLSEFRPLPFLGNPHLQTIVANLFQGPAWPLPSRERLVALPDGDRLVLHDSCPRNWQPGMPVVLLVHGLGGSHRSGHVQRMPWLLMPHGFRVVRLDLRGAGRGIAHARKFYNSGSSDDVRAALGEIHRWSPASALAAVGFSLGGNIVLKLAGEAVDHPVPGLACVAAVAPPIDLERCAALLALPRNAVYDQHFVRLLVRQVREQRRYFPDLPMLRFPGRMTVRLFDELYTAPRGGYRDALDYYRRAASLPLLGRIGLPCLVLTARDDPFVAVDSFLGLRLSRHVEVRILDRGGHLGFLGWDGKGGVRWAERRVAEWLTQVLVGAKPQRS